MIHKILEITQGELLQGELNLEITGVTIDSRAITPGDLYVPIVGENNNGHIFIADVYKNGGMITLTQEKEMEFPEKMTVIFVTSTLAAMKALAGFHRHRFKLPVIAVTGSSGKTTTKDLIGAVLSQKYCTLKTQGNFNNEYGIPQTLFQLERKHEIAVIEMGMDHLGDITKSIDEVDPDIAVITNIGLTHIEILKTQENIFLAKKEILQTLGKGKIALINGDDPFLRKLKAEDHSFQVKSFGFHGDQDLKLREYTNHSRGLNMAVIWEGQEENYSFAYPGEHNIYNCMVAIWLGHYFEMTRSEIQKGLSAFVPSQNRMDIFSVHEMTVINDSYNANPDAMKGALDVLNIMKTDHQRSIAILGDMLEMGAHGPAAHFKTGEYAQTKADILIGVGPLGEDICKGYGSNQGSVYHVSDAKAAGECIAAIMAAGDIILIKASRGMGLEKTIDYIKGEKH
ncbi:MAG: UDP-N-acetylmuramoyl-tripeptide--D-alanyl-D-alanine ligase [Acetobacterium sp.]